jgi:hypothetical protein
MALSPSRPESIELEITVVLVGDLNPKIFQPAWFALNNLLRPAEADSANIQVIHQDIVAFSTDWLSLQVTRDRFLAGTKSITNKTILLDLVKGIFGKLYHTPLRQMGINYAEKRRFATEQDWHNFGHFLLPKSPWKGLLKMPGLQGVNVRGQRRDQRTGHVLVTAESDLSTKGLATIRVNDHFEVESNQNSNKADGAQYFVDLLASDYEASIARSESIINGLLDKFLVTSNFDGITNNEYS